MYPPNLSCAAAPTLQSYSPLDNLRAAAYPHMLVTAGLWDPQVGACPPPVLKLSAGSQPAAAPVVPDALPALSMPCH